MATSYLTTVPRELSSLPRPDDGSTAYADFLSSLLASSSLLVSSIPSWTPGKSYGTVQSSSHASPPGSGPTEGLKWYARTSRHPNERLDEWYDGLGKDHSEHEAEYIESVQKARCIEVIEKGRAEVWEMTYHLPFPTTNRTFMALIVTFPPDTTAERKSFRLVSLPIESREHPTAKGTVRGRYVAIEEVVDDGEGGVTWKMATASTPAGRIPNWITEMAMPGKIAEDVPAFTTWIKKRNQPPK